jgi:indole-3-glycerol phosphate synthase
MSDKIHKINPPHILARIAEAVGRRLDTRKSVMSPHEMARTVDAVLARKGSSPVWSGRDFHRPFRDNKLSIIAEVKFASPSQGVIVSGLNPVEVAAAYLRAGAAALSVLTEEDFFHGHMDYLRAIRQAHPQALLLQKDFMLEPYQIQEALCAGADAVLIIVALVGEEGSAVLLREAGRLGLRALVEVHTEDELRIAKKIGAELIGINNRSLLDLSVSLDVTRRLRPLCPPDSLVVCESGLRSRAQLDEMSQLGCHGFLIGTSLMGTGDPGDALTQLTQGQGEQDDKRDAPCE